MEKDTKNLILGWITLAFFVGIIYMFFNWFLKLLSIVKTLDAVIIVAIITGLVTITTTAVKTIIDIKQTRLQYLTQKRETAYYQFIDMVYKINQSSKDQSSYSSEEQIKDLTKFSKEITMWG
ncbi:SbmA/BacA-like family transporter [Streptococcus henryi]|uniref:SbmA/BacA-like family transporter n=1 Tax=Streptococcus henryi TaxID=439219 RepID=UPI00037D7864|nr:SbmA/BacA-like family transporter [Streptococcus henryi]